MRARLRPTAALALALLALRVAPALADAAWEATVRYAAGGRVETFRGAARGGDLALESVERGRRLLWLAGEKRYVLVDDRRRAFTRFAESEIPGVLAERRAAAEAKAKPLLAALPEDKRKAARTLLALGDKGGDAAEPTVRAAEETAEILGRRARLYEIAWSETRKRRAWTVGDVPELADAGRRLAAVKRLDLLGGVVDWFPGMEGFPVRSESRSVVKEVVKLETGPVDAARLRVPEGYVREKPEAFLSARPPAERKAPPRAAAPPAQ